VDAVTPAGRTSDAERRAGDHPAQLDSCGEPALCCLDLTEAAQWARACHPAYAGRIHRAIRSSEPSGPVENW
jgi:hypothetical protein